MFKDVDVQEIEKKKKDQEQENQRRPTNMKVMGGLEIILYQQERFGSSNLDLLEEEFKSKTVGLVTREEFKRKRENIDNIIEQDLMKKKQAEGAKKLREKQQRKEQHQYSTSLLSFDLEQEKPQEQIQVPVKQIKQKQYYEEDEQEDDHAKKFTYGKDQKVNTNFLPDSQRDEKIKQLKKQFIQEFVREQEEIKNELIDIKFQYWDGSQIVKSLTVKKNTTILKFLEEARKEIIKDFAFIKEFSAEDLIIVMKDMILPHKLTFYDMIANKVKNRSGHQLFGGNLEYEVEVERSGTAKIIEKFKYDKINHIYPCSIWEVVDINKFR